MDNIRQFSSPQHEWIAYLMHDLRKSLGQIDQALDPIEMFLSGQHDIDREELASVNERIRRELMDADSFIAGIGSHISLEGSEPEFEKLDLDTLLEQLLVVMQLDAAAKEIEIDYRPSTEVLPVRGDSVLLARVFRNLIGNAIEYTPKYGFVGIEGSLFDGRVRVAIRDSGPGIPENALRWLFEPGFRLESSPVSRRDGRGLGLAFVRRAVDLHHGSVSVESRSEEGSCFLVELPAVQESSFKD